LFFFAYSNQFSAYLSLSLLFGVVVLPVRLWMVSPLATAGCIACLFIYCIVEIA